MSSLVRALRGQAAVVEQREWPAIPFNDVVQAFNWNGTTYPFLNGGTLLQDREEPPTDFPGYVQQLYKRSGPTFACIALRQRLFSEARFIFKRKGGSPQDVFGSPVLEPLERPWGPSSTTGDLLTRMVIDADLSGNAYIARLPDGGLSHLRPDWVTIVMGSRYSADKNPAWQSDARVIGYVYEPGGRGSSEPPQLFMPWQVAHWAPYPDPLARFRGMSWLTPVVSEIMGDQAATTHKLQFFQQGATVNLVVTLGDQVTPENFTKFTQLFEEQQAGLTNAYKTLFFGGGADVKAVGADMQQLQFTELSGQAEARIAAASGMSALVVGLGAGLEHSTFSNYAEARLAAADMVLRPMWRDAAGTLEILLDMKQLGTGTPAELWYDDSHIPFLAEDVKKRAEVQQMQAATISSLITAGYNADDAQAAVTAGDLSLLKGKHSGLVSVQLFSPGEGPNVAAPDSSNGSGNGKPPALPVAT